MTLYNLVGNISSAFLVLQLGDTLSYEDINQPSGFSRYKIEEDDDHVGPGYSIEFGVTNFPPRIVILDEMNFQIETRGRNKRRSSSIFGDWFLPMFDNDNSEDDEITTDFNTTSAEPQLIYEIAKDWYNSCDPCLALPIRPTCNSVHELLDMGGATFPEKILGTNGSWRLVLKANELSILKLLHLNRDFDKDSFQRHEIDNIVMEKLTASPYIISSFGFCGQSVITQLAPTPANRVTKNPKLSKTLRLKLARDLARGLAELHSMKRIDFRNESYKHSSPPMLYFAHQDINIGNVVSVMKDSIVWNDFNLGILSRHYRHNQSAMCRVPVNFEGNIWRSPEEIRTIPGTLAQVQPCDIYSFGNILFQILTKHEPWKHLEEPYRPNITEVTTSKLQGKLPNLRAKHKESLKHLANQVLWNAIQACYRMDPLERPTALDLAEGFDIAYQWSKTKSNASQTVARVKELFRS